VELPFRAEGVKTPIELWLKGKAKG